MVTDNDRTNTTLWYAKLILVGYELMIIMWEKENGFIFTYSKMG